MISVLLADDQPLLRRGFRMILEAEGISRSPPKRVAAPKPSTSPASMRRTWC